MEMQTKLQNRRSQRGRTEYFFLYRKDMEVIIAYAKMKGYQRSEALREILKKFQMEIPKN